MASTLERELSYENLLEYGKGVSKLADFIEDNNSNYKNVLIPSRGAYPFYDAAVIGRGVLSTALNEPFDVNYNLPEHLDITIPFTSDSFGYDIETCDLRNYWVQVYKGLHSGVDNLPSKFYKFCLENVFGIGSDLRHRNRFAAMGNSQSDYIKPIDSSSGTIFVDTVISGKAATEILESFGDDMNIKPFLIVDENGDKLKGEYKSKLEKLVSKMEGELVYIPRIFTEDRGPALTGSTSIISPDLIYEASKLNQFRDIGIKFPSVGCWTRIPKDISQILDSSGKPKLSSEEFRDWCLNSKDDSNRISGCVKTLLSSAFYVYMAQDNPRKEILERDLMTFRDMVLRVNSCDENMLDKDYTLNSYSSFLKLLPHQGKEEVSGSHVIKVNYLKDKNRELIREFEKSLRD